MSNEIQAQLDGKADEIKQLLDNPNKYTNPIKAIADILVSQHLQCGMMS
jgi:hypothetical protein